MEALLSRKNIVRISIIAVFIIANSFLLIHELFWISLIPLVIITLYLIFVAPDWIILILALLTPLSFSFEFEDFESAISIPTEPILFIVTIVFILRLFIRGNIDHQLLKHPITIAILINLFWILITTITSTLPVVSAKFFLSRLWYVIVFYFIGIHAFRDFKNIKRFIWFFSATLIIAVIYTLIRHSMHFFDQEWANKVTYPFFKDHTIYGAIIALFIPLVAIYVFRPKLFKLTSPERMIAVFFFLVLIPGLIFSYTRAAWVSIMCSVAFMAILLLRIRFQYVVILAIAATTIIISYWGQFRRTLVKTESVSSTEFKDHFESISNVTTDVSNTERINRWNSAIRMFKQKPIFGWGPGTYMFKYAPFQHHKEKTPISTDFGTLGNAHSEYLGPLAESGFLGMLSFLFLVFVIIYKGMKLFYHTENIQTKYMSFFILLALITYLSHGVMNNFLHTDKASVPFWALIGMLVALELYHKKKETENEKA